MSLTQGERERERDYFGKDEGEKNGRGINFESFENMYPRVKVRAYEEPMEIRKEDTSYIVRVVESLSLECHLPRILVSADGSRSENDSHPPHANSNTKVLLTRPIAAPKGKNSNRSNDDSETKNNGLNKDNKCKNDSNLPHARTSESPAKISLTPCTAPSKGKNNDGFDEDNKTNFRASAVPPPRAVLSSPDNDGIIGSQNQRIRKKQAPLRRQTLKSNGITGQQNQLIREKRTLDKRQISSPKTEAQTKLSGSKLESPHSTRKVFEEGGNSSTAKGKRLSELSAPRQRPPFKVGL